MCSYIFMCNCYVFDFFEMEQMSCLNFDDVEFLMDGEVSGVMLFGMGLMNMFCDCYFMWLKDCGIILIGMVCQGMMVDRCEFLLNELGDLVQNCILIGLNVNVNDIKIWYNWFVCFGYFMVVGGGGYIIEGNYWFQGDVVQNGVWFGGLILIQLNVQVMVMGNYIDNCLIEWMNEYDLMLNFVGDEYFFGGLMVMGNIFLVLNMMLGFNWLVVKFYGSGYFIYGFVVMGNVFKLMNNKINCIDCVDIIFVQFDYIWMCNVQFQGNMFNGVLVYVVNFVDISFMQGMVVNCWIVLVDVVLFFNGWVKNVELLIVKLVIINVVNQCVIEMLWVQLMVGILCKQVVLNWSGLVCGLVLLWVWMDDLI